MKKLEDIFLNWIRSKYESSSDGHMFFRCRTCHRYLSIKNIKDNAGCLCGNKMFSPANISRIEELKIVWRALWLPKITK